MWEALALLLSAASLASPNAPPFPTNLRPTWSPDGSWVAYSSDRDGAFGIWKTDGRHIRRVARNGRDPSWSPDGKTIAYTAGEGGIALVSARGGTGRLITAAGYGYEPDWSPNGRMITFVRPGGCGDGPAIETMRADGGGEEQVSGSSEFEEHFSPTWAPDGKSIAYIHDYYDGGTFLERLFPRNGTYTQISISGAAPGGPGRPSFSPNGRYLVFADEHPEAPQSPGSAGGFGTMYVLDTVTHNLRRLTRMAGSSPSWSPRGRRIAFASRTSYGVDLFLVNPDGTHLVQLTKPF